MDRTLIFYSNASDLGLGFPIYKGGKKVRNDISSDKNFKQSSIFSQLIKSKMKKRGNLLRRKKTASRKRRKQKRVSKGKKNSKALRAVIHNLFQNKFGKRSKSKKSS